MNKEKKTFISNLSKQVLYTTAHLPPNTQTDTQYNTTVDQSTGDIILVSPASLGYNANFTFHKILSSTKAIYKTKQGQAEKYLVLAYQEPDPTKKLAVQFSAPVSDPATLNNSTPVSDNHGALWIK